MNLNKKPVNDKIKDKMNTLEGWLKNFLEIYRHKYSSLSPESKKRIPRFNDFSSVCQLELVQFEHPLQQILIISRFEDEPDAKLVIHDSVPNEGLVKKLEEITKDNKWQKLLDPQDLVKIRIENYEQRFFKYYLEGQLINLYQNIILEKRPSISPPRIITQISGYISDDSPIIFSFWYLYGSIADFDANELAESIFKDLDQQDTEDDSESEVDRYEYGYLSFIYPPIWLDELPDFSIRALNSTDEHKKLILNLKYRDSTILVYKDGCIGIVERDKSKALRYLNEIMGTLVFHQIPAYSIGEYDLTSCAWRDPDYFLSSTSAPEFSLRLHQWDDRNNYSKIMYPLSYRKRVNGSELEQLINTASEFTDTIGLELVYMYIEAYTDLREKHYIQSFVLSWVIIERLINESWKNYLNDRGLSSKRVKNITESSNWTISIILETINLLKLISDEDFKDLSKLRKTRNDFIHAEGEVKETDAKECFRWCTELIRRKLINNK